MTNPLPAITGGPWFFPNGHELRTMHSDSVVAILDLVERRPTVLRTAHRGIWSMAFSPDGRTIATTGDEGTLTIWDTKTQQALATLRGQLTVQFSVAFSPDGRRVAAGTGDGLIKIWDTETYQEVAALRGHSSARGIEGLAFGSDDRTLNSAASPYSYQVTWELGAWRAPSFEEIEAAEKAKVKGQPREAHGP